MHATTKKSDQQPEALAELAKTTREKIPGDGPRNLVADDETKPIPAQNDKKHEIAEALLSAGARGKKLDPKDVGEDELPDRTRSKI
jgi:hypothetical protein